MTLPASGALTLNNIQTEFGGNNPIGLNEYYAGGGLVPAGTSGTYGAVPSSGTLSVQNFYGTSNYTPVYIEDVFSTYLYTGNGSTQTITNGIDLAGKGGLVWIKCRSAANESNLYDTARGVSSYLVTSQTSGGAASSDFNSFNASGFTLNTPTTTNNLNRLDFLQASWTFRKQPKFFDVVTWTGNSTARTIAHNLGSAPGCIIVKATSSSSYQWAVYHRSLVAGNIVWLNLTDASTASSNTFTTTAPTATEFSLGTASGVNDNGVTYVAYIFAHDAGGFGLTGTDNVISCGSYTGSYSAGNPGPTVTLGFEPQFLLIKSVSHSHDWTIMDNMRGMPVNDSTGSLNPNNNTRDDYNNRRVSPTATGFIVDPSGQGVYQVNQNGGTYIYIAIRRPHRVPTDASKVFGINLYSGTGSQQTITTSFNAPDAALSYVRNASGWSSPIMYDRLRGSRGLFTDQTAAEIASADYGAVISTNARAQEIVGMFGSSSGKTYVTWSFARACGFFDVVCWTGNGGLDQVVTHGLGVTPSMLITKQRNGSNSWATIVNTGSGAYPCRQLYLNDSSSSTASFGNQSTATTCVPMAATGFGSTYVTYLFATCPGVSKVGSYTGTGTAQQIDCGFTSGARFVMIKRTDAGGSWLVFDSSRGITSGNDPYLYLNSTIYGEITFDNFIHPYSAGFQLTNSPYGAEVNANGGSYIYLAIA